MKVKFALSMLLAICFIAVQAQRKSYLSVTIGPSIPIGNFGDDDVDNEHAGSAKVGFNGNLTIAHAVKESKWGYAFSVTSGMYKFDTQFLEDAFNDATNIQGDWSSKSYSVIGVYGGGFYSKSFSDDKLAFDAKFLIGMAVATFPEIDADFGSDVSLSIKGDKRSTSFAYQIGFGLRYNISEKIGLLINLDAFKTNASFEVTTTLIADEVEKESSEFDLPITALNFGVGVAFRL